MSDVASLLAAMDATWPAAEIVDRDGWRLRRGAGGGKRVSAASRRADGALVEDACAAMAAWGQAPLFQITADDASLDSELAARGFRIVDPVVILAAPAAALRDDRPETARVFRGASRVALMEEIWRDGGVGPARLAVMDRAAEPKTFLLSRLEDRPAGVAFAAASGGIAMLHALETLAPQRRKGAARMLIASAARFAEEAGAGTLALAVTEANAAALALYRSAGFAEAARYHYRIGPTQETADD